MLSVGRARIFMFVRLTTCTGVETKGAGDYGGAAVYSGRLHLRLALLRWVLLRAAAVLLLDVVAALLHYLLPHWRGV